MATATRLIPESKTCLRCEVCKRPLVFGDTWVEKKERKMSSGLPFLPGYSSYGSRNHAPVLTFYASFDDRGEPPRDREKFRDCRILYFVEDDTIKVYEPWKRNSGMPQGVIVGRNKLRKPQGGLYTLEDLNIGETVIFYGKPFKILDCDNFTKNILKEMGYRVRTPEPKPVDPVSEDRHVKDKHWTNHSQTW
ncbi:EF-hand domain-containing family member C2 [Caerostris extrusa]|uniref:EF-hand domain-containing family member C2 n=1 Tax=Caerostris extrusa TaxID=172846 RepID=A0AAV4U5G7_CAEEX|nr:EF-hand domain-containing family member C2 [Caerostris extrusa]